MSFGCTYPLEYRPTQSDLAVLTDGGSNSGARRRVVGRQISNDAEASTYDDYDNVGDSEYKNHYDDGDDGTSEDYSTYGAEADADADAATEQDEYESKDDSAHSAPQYEDDQGQEDEEEDDAAITKEHKEKIMAIAMKAVKEELSGHLLSTHHGRSFVEKQKLQQVKKPVSKRTKSAHATALSRSSSTSNIKQAVKKAGSIYGFSVDGNRLSDSDGEDYDSTSKNTRLNKGASRAVGGDQSINVNLNIVGSDRNLASSRTSRHGQSSEEDREKLDRDRRFTIIIDTLRQAVKCEKYTHRSDEEPAGIVYIRVVEAKKGHVKYHREPIELFSCSVDLFTEVEAFFSAMKKKKKAGFEFPEMFVHRTMPDYVKAHRASVEAEKRKKR